MITSHVMAWLRVLELVQERKMDLSIRAYDNLLIADEFSVYEGEAYEVELYTLGEKHYEVSGKKLEPLATELLAVLLKDETGSGAVGLVQIADKKVSDEH